MVLGILTVPLAARFTTWERVDFFLLRQAHGLVYFLGNVLKAYAKAAFYLLNPILTLAKPFLRLVANIILPFYQLLRYLSLRLEVALFQTHESMPPHLFKRKYEAILIYAAINGHLDRIRWLQTKGIDVHQYIYNRHPLYYAIKGKQPEVVKYLLADADEAFFSSQRGPGFTCLLEAAVRANHLGNIKALLDVMKDFDLDFAAKDSGLVFMSPIVSEYRLSKLSKSMFQNMVTCLTMMAEASLEVDGITELQLIPQIMQLVSQKPEWCTDTAYKNICDDVFKKAQKVIEANIKKTSTLVVPASAVAEPKLPMPEPVIFETPGENQAVDLSVGPEPVIFSEPVTSAAANDALPVETSKEKSKLR